MTFKAKEEDSKIFESSIEEEEKVEEVLVEKPTPKPAQVGQDDLFSAHDFDIKIDLEVPLPGKLF